MSAWRVPLAPRKRCIKAVIPRENRNSTSSWKSAHKFLQSRRYATSKSLLGMLLMACCLESGGRRGTRRSVEKQTFLNEILILESYSGFIHQVDNV